MSYDKLIQWVLQGLISELKYDYLVQYLQYSVAWLAVSFSLISFPVK